MDQKGHTICIMENSFIAAMVSWTTGTQGLGGCNLGKFWQGSGKSEKEPAGLGHAPRTVFEVTISKKLENTFLQNRISFFIMDLYAK